MQKSSIIILKADEGMVLTNGSNYASSVMLREGDDGSEWSEITQEAYKGVLKEQEEAATKETDS